jgi:hypothetical protein
LHDQLINQQFSIDRRLFSVADRRCYSLDRSRVFIKRF